jgi:hypothetical protein
MTTLPQRLVDLAEKAGRDLRLIHTRIDGELATAEKGSLVGAINEVAERIQVNIAVGISPPGSPSTNDLWVDTN